MKHYVYWHKDPVTKKPFYIGKGVGGRSYDTSGRSAEWHKERERILNAYGFDREVEIVASFETQESAFEFEALEIYRAGLMGHELVNIANPQIKGDYEESGDGISAIVKYRRKNLKLTQEEFADRAGVGLRFIRELEQSKKSTMRMGKVNQVLGMFGLTLSVAKKNLE